MDVLAAVVIVGVAILFGVMAIAPLVADTGRSARPLARVVSIDEAQGNRTQAA